MTMQDPVADMFSRIKNAQAVNKVDVTMPLSKTKLAIANVLKAEGYVDGVEQLDIDGKPNLQIVLRYFEGKPVIATLKRVSRPGLRIYKNKHELPRILNGLGVAIVSTSKGIMSDRKARSIGEGGEVLGEVT